MSSPSQVPSQCALPRQSTEEAGSGLRLLVLLGQERPWGGKNQFLVVRYLSAEILGKSLQSVSLSIRQGNNSPYADAARRTERDSLELGTRYPWLNIIVITAGLHSITLISGCSSCNQRKRFLKHPLHPHLQGKSWEHSHPFPVITAPSLNSLGCVY